MDPPKHHSWFLFFDAFVNFVAKLWKEPNSKVLKLALLDQAIDMYTLLCQTLVGTGWSGFSKDTLQEIGLFIAVSKDKHTDYKIRILETQFS